MCRNCFADLTGIDVYTAMFREIRDWKKRSVPLVLPDFGQGCGAISNLSFGHTRADLLLGAWQGGLFFFRETMTQLKAERGLKRIIISGGSSRYPEILQLTADILSLPVIKNKAEEVGTLGCAMLAGSGSGVYSSIGNVIRELPEQLSCYEPQDDYSSEHQKWMQFFNANKHQ
jgi:xylulokinase